MDNTTETKKQNKTADRKAYMREYMKQYNAKRPKLPRTPRQVQTDEQKKVSRRTSLQKYYMKNKGNILQHKKLYNTQKRILTLTNKLNSLKCTV